MCAYLKLNLDFLETVNCRMNNINTPSQTQSELRKQLEKMLKKFLITIDLSYLVGVNVVFGVFSLEEKKANV